MSDEKETPIVLDKMADIVLKYRPKEKKKKPRQRSRTKKGETGVKYITPQNWLADYRREFDESEDDDVVRGLIDALHGRITG